MPPLTPDEERFMVLYRLLSEWDRHRMTLLAELLAATPTGQPADHA